MLPQALTAAGTITFTVIDFGDGVISRNSTASHTYSSPGTYTVVATVADNHGVSSTASATVTVSAALKPVAVLSVTPRNGAAPLTVLADSTESSGAPIISRSISFGDGTSVSGTMKASHVFRFPGAYQLILTVTSNTGLISTTSQTVLVHPQVNRPPRDKPDEDPQGGREPHSRLRW